MKTFNVEIKKVSYVTIAVEAESQDRAEKKAWDEFRFDESGIVKDWDIESVSLLSKRTTEEK